MSGSGSDGEDRRPVRGFGGMEAETRAEQDEEPEDGAQTPVERARRGDQPTQGATESANTGGPGDTGG